jgi:peptide-methionine (R)-S-oxide reductase
MKNMRTIIAVAVAASAALFTFSMARQQPAAAPAKHKFACVKTDAEWKKILPPKTYQVLRHADTEEAYSGNLWDNHEAGTYFCAGCGQEVFTSKTKFDSHTGWPSFWQPVSKGAVINEADHSFGMERTEVICSRCGGHLGHVFDDGPKPTGLRYCMNSAALKFKKAK